MASDIGVVRFAGENDESFIRRVVYSSSRFCILTYCLDDGADGRQGIAKVAINRRLSRWIQALDGFAPGLETWFDADGYGIQAIYNRLIDLGDIAPHGFDGTYMTARPSMLVASRQGALLTGFFDPTRTSDVVCGVSLGTTVLSGIATICPNGLGVVERIQPWWLTDLDYLQWSKAADYGDVNYVDPWSSRWNIRYPDVWIDEPRWVEGLTLARSDGAGDSPIFFVAKKTRGVNRVSQITWIQAQELFFHLREANKNAVNIRYEQLDGRHVRSVLPIGFVPGHLNRILDSLGWPIDDAVDRFNRVLRVEAVPIVEELLAVCGIGFREASNG